MDSFIADFPLLTLAAYLAMSIRRQKALLPVGILSLIDSRKRSQLAGLNGLIAAEPSPFTSSG